MPKKGTPNMRKSDHALSVLTLILTIFMVIAIVAIKH
jgi:hypothetical protein